MKAKKENKVYRITTDQEKQRYLREGFDIYNDEGVLTEYSPLKKIEYCKYAALKKELEELKQGDTPKQPDADVFEILSDYASEHGIDLGNTSSVSGVVKKIKGWKKENAQGNSSETGG